ncbi:sodium:solute symporter [uncultured Erythrobacter sp.]|uniref:sodium:solute symporter family protein n=1 Tax=uncultured Erythrobacter sp. TaxID=263913 RepID=UPI00260EE394|nr:sodium:solute symporter family protein [uncultured Erythrobacter sp.]
MERWQIIALVIAAYLAVTLAIGLLSGRRASKSVAGYVAGDRDFGLLVMYFVLGASIFSAFAFLGGPGWAYSRGAAAFYILSYGVLGIAPYFFLGPKAAALGRKFGYVTQAQLICGRFPSRGLSLMIAVLTVLAFIPYITLQMRGAGIVIEAVTEGNVPLWAGSLVAYGIVLIYVLFSGVAAVGWTNTFQGIFMLTIAWTLGLYLPISLYGGVGDMFTQIMAERPELLTMPGLTASGAPWSWGGYSSAIIVSAVGLMMWPHLFMKAFTARSDDTLRRTVVLFPTFQLFLIPVFLIGFAGVLYPETPPSSDFILPFMILNAELPAIVVGLFCAGALSASMSTGDSLMHAAASVTVEDGIKPFTEMSDVARRRLIQALVIAVGALAYAFAVVEGVSLVVLLLTAYGIICQLAPPIVAAMYWSRATTAGVIAGFAAGSAAAAFFFLSGYLGNDLRPFDLHEGFLGLLVHVPVLIAASLMTQPQSESHRKAFTEVAA